MSRIFTKSRKGVVGLIEIFIFLIFTIGFITIPLVSLKFNIAKIVDIEFKANNVQAMLASVITSSKFDKDANRELNVMELIGERLVGITGTPEVDNIKETLEDRLDKISISKCHKLTAEKIEVIGEKKDCEREHKAVTKIPLPFNDGELAKEVVLEAD